MVVTHTGKGGFSIRLVDTAAQATFFEITWTLSVEFFGSDLGVSTAQWPPPSCVHQMVSWFHTHPTDGDTMSMDCGLNWRWRAVDELGEDIERDAFEGTAFDPGDWESANGDA